MEAVQRLKRERERELHGGGADYDRRKRSRFGGWWSSYYIGDANRGNLVEEIPAGTTGAEDIRHWDIAPPPEYFTELARQLAEFGLKRPPDEWRWIKP